MKLKGRFLWLTEDPALLTKQLAGDSIDLDTTHSAHPLSLHYGVNTDAMISGAACTLGYTKNILGPYFLENFKDVVSKEAVRLGGFQVIVGGDAYGSGSSREVAVVAHQGAGIELIIAKSFQRIFQENMVYCGLPFTTDFSIIKTLEKGDDVDLEKLNADLPPLFHAVSKWGGLMRYGTALLSGDATPLVPEHSVFLPKTSANGSEESPKTLPGMTCIEKIVAKNVWLGGNQNNGVDRVMPGDQVLCKAGFRGMHEYTAGMVMALYEKEWGNTPIDRPELAAAFEDHFVLIDSETVPLTVKGQRLEPARKLKDEMVSACKKNGIRLHGPDSDLQGGVCHRIVVEDYATPGSIIVLTDSHTPTAGVLNSFAFGVGSTAMAFALRTGMIPVTVPKTIRVVVSGTGDSLLSPKDLILHLIGDPYFREEQWRTSPTDTCVIQFGGPSLNHWNVDELSVLTNMTVEGGLMTGIVEPCTPVADFLTQHGRPPNNQFIYPDDDALYVHTIEIDLGAIPLTVATPGDSRNRIALDKVTDIAIHNVVIASCTGGSISDLRSAAAVLKGRTIKEGVRVTVTPSSDTVAQQAEKEGILDLFRAQGAVVTEPGCGSCIGNGPGIPFENETTASTTNRNFDRRMGASGPVYLVSPAVAAATAITGHLTDPRDLGLVKAN